MAAAAAPDDPWGGDRFPIPAQRGWRWQVVSRVMVESVRALCRVGLALNRNALVVHHPEVRAMGATGWVPRR
jgi:hypothetical protein